MTTITSTQGAVWPEIAASRSFHVPGLDTLRTLSVGIVMASHVLTFVRVPGDVGVTVFFFISGFLITSLLLREAARSDNVNIPAFYVRRYVRLMPEMLAYVVTTSAIVIMTSPRLSPLDVAGSLLYFYNYVKAFRGDIHYVAGTFEHLWSLSVEEHFYIGFPLLVAAFRKNVRFLTGILVGLIVITPIWRLVYYLQAADPHAVYYTSDCRFDSIAYGCVVAILFNSGLAVSFWTRLGRPTLFTFVASLVLLAGSFLLPSAAQYMFKFSVQGLSLSLAFVAIYAGNADSIALRALRFRPTAALGKYTYGIYLWHPLLISCLAYAGIRAHGSGVAYQIAILLTIALAATLAAWASFNFVLSPFSKLRRRFGSHL
jgi:peptidoglycan/LPS O-acetylase OafA/YrhL